MIQKQILIMVHVILMADESLADNYNVNADGSCIYNGCTDQEACNWDNEANTDDGSCTYPSETYLDCDGACSND